MDATSCDDKLSYSSGNLRTLTALTSFAIFCLISLGGIVRVTESGLACPDWPLCHGKLIPPLDLPVIIEYSHRLLALFVFCLVVSVAFPIFHKFRHNTSLVKILLVTLTLLSLQILLGGVTVLTELRPEIISLHLATGQAFFAAFILLTCKIFLQDSSCITPKTSWFADKHISITAILIYSTVITGSLVTATGAFAACAGWPLCNGQVFPTNHLAGIHWLHRLMVLFSTMAVCWILVSSWRRSLKHLQLFFVSLLVFLMLIQIMVGAGTIWLHFTAFSKAIHLIVSTMVWGVVIINLGLIVFPSTNHSTFKTGVRP